MINRLDFATFIEHLKAGTDRTRRLIDRLTEYHGGPAETEYLLTADIAREFIERDFQVKVECKYRNLLNAYNKLTAVVPKDHLRGWRSDVAILEDLLPLAIIEVKIGIRRLSALHRDFEKITRTLSLMKARSAANVIGASVFQIHISGGKHRQSVTKLRAAMARTLNKLEKSLRLYGETHTNFDFELIPLQADDAGIVGQEIVHGEVESYLGAKGHATQFFAITVKSNRPIPAAETAFQQLKAEAYEGRDQAVK